MIAYLSKLIRRRDQFRRGLHPHNWVEGYLQYMNKRKRETNGACVLDPKCEGAPKLETREKYMSVADLRSEIDEIGEKLRHSKGE